MINTTKYMQKKKCTIFPCHTLKHLSKTPLSFEKRKEKQGDSIVTTSLQVGQA